MNTPGPELLEALADAEFLLLAFYTYDGTTYELYKDANGDLWRAPVSCVMDVHIKLADVLEGCGA